MANSELTKLFVLVSTANTESFKSKYVAPAEGTTRDTAYDKKIVFLEGTSEIFTNGHIYGLSDEMATTISNMISAINLNADGTKKDWYAAADSIKDAANLVAAIEALDEKAKSLQDELDAEEAKIAASKTLKEGTDSYEFSGKLVYKAAVPVAEGQAAVPAYIVMTDEDGTELANTKINVSDLIGNGVLDHSEYVKTTGILHLYFKQADGSLKDEQINLADMLDVDDVIIGDNSKDYLNVTLAGGEGEDMVLDAKIKKMSEVQPNTAAEGQPSNAVTGLADALDVKTYVDGKTTDLAVTAEGDDYVSANVDAAEDNKHVIVSTNVQDVTASAGTRGTWTVTDAGVATLAGETAPSMSGVAKSLVDGAQAATAVKTYIDARVAAEAAERAAKIEAAVKALDKTEAEVGTGANVHFKYSETDGIVTINNLGIEYATVTKTDTTSTDAAPATDAALNVTEGEESKLVKASDLKTVAAHAADLVAQEANRVNKKIADLGGEVSDLDDGNYIKVTVATTAGEVSGVTVEFDPWETYSATAQA